MEVQDLQYEQKTIIPTATIHVYHLHLDHLEIALKEMLQFAGGQTQVMKTLDIREQQDVLFSGTAHQY